MLLPVTGLKSGFYSRLLVIICRVTGTVRRFLYTARGRASIRPITPESKAIMRPGPHPGASAVKGRVIG